MTAYDAIAEFARQHSSRRRIDYRLGDAADLREFADAEFDGVVCFIPLMDIAELGPTLRAVHRVLRTGGWFVFAVLHPCYHTPQSGEVETADGGCEQLVSISPKRTGGGTNALGRPAKSAPTTAC